MDAREAAGEPARELRLAVVVLVAASGAVEPLSFLALDHVFAGVMTGNLALLGMALVIACLPFLATRPQSAARAG